MKQLLIIVLLCLLSACGSSAPVGSQAALPTSAPEPTLSADTRAALNTIRSRAGSIVAAAKQLQQLSTGRRASVTWQSNVKAQAQIITGGRNVLKAITLPDHLFPLAERLTEAGEKCGAAADAIVADLSLATLQKHRDLLSRWCVNEFERVQRMAAAV